MESAAAAARLASTVLFLFLSLLLLDRLTLHPDPDRISSSRKRIPELPLRFRSDDGTFKILQIADMHFGNGAMTRCRDVPQSEFAGCSDDNTTRFVRRLIEAEKPDLIAFTGDNIFGPTASDAAESMLRALAPAIESKLPWAAILGNHDQESTMTRMELMHFISLMDYSVSRVYPSHDYDDDDDHNINNNNNSSSNNNIDGFGNYDLKVMGAFGSEMTNTSVLDLLFLDSGDRVTLEGGRRTYGWIKESQLQWVRSVTSISRSPALTFFHIPIPEVRTFYTQRLFVGQFQEAVACSVVNSGVLDTLVSTKTVKAAFMGHDHVNDFCGNLGGVWLCYGGGAGYHGYGREGWSRRARVIQARLAKGKRSWRGVERITTWKRLDDQGMTKIDDQLLWESRQQQGSDIV